MIQRLFALALTAALALSTSAGATVFFGTYMPSDTPVTEQRQPHHFLPLDYRLPNQSFTNGAAGVSGYCANGACNPWIGEGVMTEFVAPTSFTASRLIVVASLSSPFGNRRVGFNVSRWDEATSTWVGLSYMQIESGLVPQGTVVEIDVPFGLAGGGYAHFNYQPIQFTAGSRYRIEASAWAGALGWFNWYNSAKPASPGQTLQYSAPHSSFGGVPTNAAWQPAFAFTDGGALVAQVVPEPATWAMMIGGFGAAGAALRRRKFAPV